MHILYEMKTCFKLVLQPFESFQLLLNQFRRNGISKGYRPGVLLFGVFAIFFYIDYALARRNDTFTQIVNHICSLFVTLQDCSPPAAVHPGREWVWAVPPQAAQPTPTPYPSRTAVGSEESSSGET